MERLRSAFLHLRIPFSVFLMPVYWFALSNATFPNAPRALLVFAVLHLFVYPASNGYNSYFDRDEGSIGGLEEPPPVDRTLYYLVLLFDLLALGISLFVSLRFAAMVLIYLLVSKAYSHPVIRLKKDPLWSTLVIALFQGGFTYGMVRAHVGEEMLPLRAYLEGEGVMFLLASLFLLGIYPITQIYQHEEDRRHGDRTLSMLLGKKGTLLFSLLTLGGASLLLLLLYVDAGRWTAFWIFLFATLLAGAWLSRWLYKLVRDPSMADFRHTMWTNAILSLGLSFAFIGILFFG
jgi:4-hydroxybenzoate polyprenyltransferase